MKLNRTTSTAGNPNTGGSGGRGKTVGLLGMITNGHHPA